jgi:proline racemase
VGGDVVRLVVDGFPAPRGKSMHEKRQWAARHADALRRQVLFEPRGHRDLRGAVLTEPAAPGSHAGLLCMDSAGYGALSGSAIVAVSTIALERGLVVPGGDARDLVFDTPAGIVRAQASIDRGDAGALRVERVRYTSVPSFVMLAGVPVTLGARSLRADVAFAGGFYAIVDAEAAGVGLSAPFAPELRRAGMQIRKAVDAAHSIVHPADPRLHGIDGAIFTAPPSREDSDLRSATVSADGSISRSPDGNSTAAVMAVLCAMGFLDEGATFTHESFTGATFTAAVQARTTVAEFDAIIPAVEARAWITAEHTLVAADDDPLGEGFLL